jgi:mRNA interferase MazF
VVARSWVPESGDIIWIDFNPQTGHEQAGHRPALVLSPAAYNGATSLLLCVPMTTKAKGYRFEVRLGDSGVALADQVKSFDWRMRGARRKGRATKAELEAVRARVRALVG